MERTMSGRGPVTLCPVGATGWPEHPAIGWSPLVNVIVPDGGAVLTAAVTVATSPLELLRSPPAASPTRGGASGGSRSENATRGDTAPARSAGAGSTARTGTAPPGSSGTISGGG